ncbi:hypothetical protein DYBT9623_05342 [Dyadobacter sp. CECT 9623]|uniref:Uncharacterized protein n=1 Tax=Dyadobacter linearis TaxID=2823330 RepID=A0ABM8UYA7_9BACT|nr:hypothetical protein DYBT9623_05342 [Dyadobacter sp. CECT 9623]
MHYIASLNNITMNNNRITKTKKTIQLILFFILALNIISFKSLWISIGVIAGAIILTAFTLKKDSKENKNHAYLSIFATLGLVVFILYRNFM